MKKIICLVLAIMMFTSSMLTGMTVEAQSTPKIDLSKLQSSIDVALKNTLNDITSYYTMAADLIKLTIEKFKDVKESDWFAKDLAVIYSYGQKTKNSIINGLPDGSFNPTGDVTRVQFVKMLVQAMGYNKVDGSSFNDIGYDKYWGRTYIETAVKEGIILTSEQGEMFWGDVPLKRADMAIMMARALKLPESNNTSPYADMPENNGYATKLYEEYLIKGIEQNKNILFNANGLTSRAEAATIIARVLEYKQDPAKYKKKMIAEVKANEFIEPEFEVRNINNKKKYIELYIANYTEYNEDYSFNAKFNSLPQLNKTWDTGLYGPPVESDYSEGWGTYDSLTYYKGYIIPVFKDPYYLDKAMKKTFIAKPGMTFEFKVTIKKGEKTKEYMVPVAIPQ